MGNLPIGQGIAVTPMQMAAGYSAIANGGILRPPHIVERVGARAARKPKGQRVISEATAASRARMLEGVLGPGGTASGAAIQGYVLGGKTGTAEKPDEYGGYSKTKFVSSFVGFAPGQAAEAAGRRDGRRAAGRHLRRHRRRARVPQDHRASRSTT